MLTEAVSSFCAQNYSILYYNAFVNLMDIFVYEFMPQIISKLCLPAEFTIIDTGNCVFWYDVSLIHKPSVFLSQALHELKPKASKLLLTLDK